MFNLGLPELVLIGAAALLVFGPKKLPELAKGLGKGIRDFKKSLEGGDEEEKAAEELAKKAKEAERLPPSETIAQGTKTEVPKPTGVRPGDDR